MVKYNIRWSPRAKQELKDIYDYIATHDSKMRAQYVVRSVRQVVQDVAICPTKHHILDSENPNIRFALKWKFKIIFYISSQGYISILKIFYTSQHPNKAAIFDEV